jgi:hypothetical protein
MVWNPRRRAVTLFGGFSADSGVADVWEWDGTSWSHITPGVEPGGRGYTSMFRSGDGYGLDVYSGSRGLGTFNTETWELSWIGNNPRESCLLPVDADGDGLAGCADPDCFFVCNPACPPGAPCDGSAPHCGDGTCNAALETCRMCPQDCGACPAVCGDGFCDPGETSATCPGDCP